MLTHCQGPPTIGQLFGHATYSLQEPIPFPIRADAVSLRTRPFLGRKARRTPEVVHAPHRAWRLEAEVVGNGQRPPPSGKSGCHAPGSARRRDRILAGPRDCRREAAARRPCRLRPGSQPSGDAFGFRSAFGILSWHQNGAPGSEGSFQSSSSNRSALMSPVWPSMTAASRSSASSRAAGSFPYRKGCA